MASETSTRFLPAMQGLAAAGMARVRAIRKIGRDARGAVALEYGLLAGLIVVVLILAISSFGSGNSAVWNNVRNKVVNAG